MTVTVKEAADQLTVLAPETTMTVKVATHLDPPMTVAVTAVLDLSMTVPADTMMTVVTVDHPHRSDTAAMTMMTVGNRLTMTVVLLEASMTVTVSIPMTVVTVEDPAHLTVAAPHPLHPVLIDTTMTVTFTVLLETSMTVQVDTMMTVGTVPVDTMVTVVTVGHPHHNDATMMTVMTVGHRLTVTVILLEASMTVTVSMPMTVVTVEDPDRLTVVAPHPLRPVLLDTTMTVTVTVLLESSMTVQVYTMMTVGTVPVDTMVTVVTVGHPHHNDTATMTVMTVDYRLSATAKLLQSGTGTTAMTVTVGPASSIAKSFHGRVNMVTFLTAEHPTSLTQRMTQRTR
jgi:hypothetical protein